MNQKLTDSQITNLFLIISYALIPWAAQYVASTAFNYNQSYWFWLVCLFLFKQLTTVRIRLLKPID